MYTSLYLHPVRKGNVESFVRVVSAAADAYMRLGAAECVLYVPGSLEAKYGCAGFESALDLAEDEVLFVELNSFRDKHHHDEVMARVDGSPEIDRLYDELTSILEVSRIVRGEFERII
jgi:uncharacterized protein YbaA (DUF1428 family)